MKMAYAVAADRDQIFIKKTVNARQAFTVFYGAVQG
jgi:hypothetical protein